MKTHAVSETLPLFSTFPAAERGAATGPVDTPQPDGQAAFALVLAAALAPQPATPRPATSPDGGDFLAAVIPAEGSAQGMQRSFGAALPQAAQEAASAASVATALLSMASLAQWTGDDLPEVTPRPAPVPPVADLAASAPDSALPAGPVAPDSLRPALAQDAPEDAPPSAIPAAPEQGSVLPLPSPPGPAPIAAPSGFSVATAAAAASAADQGVPAPSAPVAAIPAATALAASRPAADPADSRSARPDSPPEPKLAAAVVRSAPASTRQAVPESEPAQPPEGGAGGGSDRASGREAPTAATVQPPVFSAALSPVPSDTILASSPPAPGAAQDLPGPGRNAGFDTTASAPTPVAQPDAQRAKTAAPVTATPVIDAGPASSPVSGTAASGTAATPVSAPSAASPPLASLAASLGATAAVAAPVRQRDPAATAGLRPTQGSLAESRLLAVFDAAGPSQDSPLPEASPPLPATDRVASATSQASAPAGPLPAAPGAQPTRTTADPAFAAASSATPRRETQASAKPLAAQAAGADPLSPPAPLPPVTEVAVTEDTGALLAGVTPDRATAAERFDATQPTGTSRGASPHNLAQQLAQALPDSADRPVELTLSPEELGKVRMTLHTSNASITVSVLAERPETLDLMRRNIDSLARDFRDMGYSDISFEFGQQPGRHQAPQDHPGFAERSEVEPPVRFETASLAVQPALIEATGGLDLRF